MKVYAVVFHTLCDNPWCSGTQVPDAIFSSRDRAEEFARKNQKAYGSVEILQYTVDSAEEGVSVYSLPKEKEAKK